MGRRLLMSLVIAGLTVGAGVVAARQGLAAGRDGDPLGVSDRGTARTCQPEAMRGIDALRGGGLSEWPMSR